MPHKPSQKGAKRYPLNLRTTEDQRRAIEDSAARSGRSLIQEVEFLLEFGSQMRELCHGAIDAGDVARFAQSVEALKGCLKRAGESPSRWLQYIHLADVGVHYGDEKAIERMNALVESEVQHRYDEARKYLAQHGVSPQQGALKFSADASEDEKRNIVEQVAEHRHFARYVIEIEANRAARELRALVRDPLYRDRSSPLHKNLARRRAELQMIIDRHAEHGTAED
jgi:virulence-associated protein VapD